MKSYLLISAGLLIGTVSHGQNLFSGADFLDLDANWAAFDGGVQTPSDFVTVSGTDAIVGFLSAGETNFYQEFVPGSLAPGTYTFESTISNITADGTLTPFVKVFNNGDYGQFNGTAFQGPGAVAGLNTLTYDVVGTEIVQFGWFVTGDTSGSYTISAPSLTAVTPVPEPSTYAMLFGLIAAALFVYKRRR